MQNLKIKIIILILFFFPLTLYAQEARLFLSSGAGTYYAGRDITTRVVVNSGGGVGINAVESKILFNPKKVKIKSISKNSSIFGLWPVEPKFSNNEGVISFAGGTTTPFKDTAGVIFNIVFTPLESGKIFLNIETSTSAILSADGQAKNILKDADDGGYLIGNSSIISQAENLKSKLAGYILLQVEKEGRSWYFNPTDKRRYFLGRPTDAFNLMRKLSLGVNHKYIITYLGKSFPKNMSGKILLDVEDSGKAYYIYPKDLKAYYLGRPDDAFKIMRELGLGISNDNIMKIADWAI